MNKENVTIHIVAGYGDQVGFNSGEWGKTRSTEDKINVIRVGDGYSVVFDDDVFEQISLSKLTSSMITTFMSNVPNTIFDFRIMYHYDGADDTYFDLNVAKHVLDLDDMLRKIDESKKIPAFTYTRLEGMQEVYHDFRMELEADEEDAEDGYGDYAEDDDDYDGSDWLGQLMGKPIKEEKEQKSNDYYGRSRVWKNCKQPKKMINRHGVLIASDKDDLRKDEKIIKAFLKDFIPGSSKWKKEFRDDVMKRWMSMYAISKKQLKRLEKAHRSRPVDCNKVKKMVNIADRLFNVPVDRWYDPTK